MEPTAPFDLNLAVEQWLAHMRRKRSFRPDDLEELRSHLLDHTDDSLARGLNAEQVFHRAISQLGETAFLVAEYRKVNRWYTFRRSALALGGRALASRKVIAFSLLFVSLTFGSMFGQKPTPRLPEKKAVSPPPAATQAAPSDTLTNSTDQPIPAPAFQP
jgi:hypothetical protein